MLERNFAYGGDMAKDKFLSLAIFNHFFIFGFG